MKKVTIITSVFNAGEFLQPFLENISQQTIFNECWLYLVCCGMPRTHPDLLACHNFANRNRENVKFHELIQDPGIYAAWNYVVKKCETPFLTNANVDDRLHPACIERHVRLLEQKPDVDLAYCYNICTFKVNDDINVLDQGTNNRYATYEFDPKIMLRANLPHNHPVWRKSLHDRFGLFDPNLKSAGDWEFWLRCVAGGARFELIRENLGLYYWNPVGLSTMPSKLGERTLEETRIQRIYQGPINELLRKSKEGAGNS